MKKLIALIGISFCLSGCLAVPAFVAGATAGGAVIYDQRSFKTMAQDHTAEAYAQKWINEDPELKENADISVVVFNHVALMVGQARTPELRARAFKIVSLTKNISRIYNEVMVGGSTSLLQHTNDDWLTTKVKTKMLTKKGLESTQIKVVTDDNVVYLMGLVSPEQAKLATDVARKVSGVTRVVKVFQYI